LMPGGRGMAIEASRSLLSLGCQKGSTGNAARLNPATTSKARPSVTLGVIFAGLQNHCRKEPDGA
jgi:hypothetical protein